MGRPADYLPSGQWLPAPCNGGPENRPGGDDSDPGLASRRERGLTANKRITLEPAWTAAYEKGRGPKDSTVRREGTREPRRRGATCCCGLSRQPQVRRVWTVTYVSLFETVPLERAVNITLSSLNDDITHATDVLIVGLLERMFQ